MTIREGSERYGVAAHNARPSNQTEASAVSRETHVDFPLLSERFKERKKEYKASKLGTDPESGGRATHPSSSPSGNKTNIHAHINNSST